MDKVKITQEQADAIELTRAKGLISQEIVQRYFHNDLIQVNGYLEISNMPLDILIRALYIGYEVEETPEDKVSSYFHSNGNLSEAQTNYKQIVIVDVLNRLGIKIVGVNHD